LTIYCIGYAFFGLTMGGPKKQTTAELLINHLKT